MSPIRLFAATALAAVGLTGCTVPSESQKSAKADEEIVTVSFQSPRRPRSELRALELRAGDGNGEAAFELHAYYSFSVESDAKKSRRFFKRAVELQHPAALYRVGFDEWCHKERPDIDLAEQFVKQAIALGYRDDKGLQGEIEHARATGKIPSRSALRLFPGQPDIELKKMPNSESSAAPERKSRRWLNEPGLSED